MAAYPALPQRGWRGHVSLAMDHYDSTDNRYGHGAAHGAGVAGTASTRRRPSRNGLSWSSSVRHYGGSLWPCASSKRRWSRRCLNGVLPRPLPGTSRASLRGSSRPLRRAQSCHSGVGRKGTVMPGDPRRLLPCLVDKGCLHVTTGDLRRGRTRETQEIAITRRGLRRFCVAHTTRRDTQRQENSRPHRRLFPRHPLPSPDPARAA